MYVLTDETGRITATAEKKEYLLSDAFEYEFPEDFNFAEIGEYVIKNGELERVESHEARQERIANLKANLAETDYVVIKIAEAKLEGRELDKDYSGTISARKKWREEINELEESNA